MAVRRVKKEDAKRIAEIFTFGWRTAYFELIPHKFLFSELDVIKRYEKLQTEIEKEQFYVYEEDIVKGVMLLREPQDEASRETVMELAAIYVEPMFKKQGIGTKLIEESEKRTIEAGKEEIKLWVFEKNQQSRNFYEKCGYIEEQGCTKVSHFNQKEIRYGKKLKISRYSCNCI